MSQICLKTVCDESTYSPVSRPPPSNCHGSISHSGSPYDTEPLWLSRADRYHKIKAMGKSDKVPVNAAILQHLVAFQHRPQYPKQLKIFYKDITMGKVTLNFVASSHWRQKNRHPPLWSNKDGYMKLENYQCSGKFQTANIYGKWQRIQLQWNIEIALLLKRNVFPTLPWHHSLIELGCDLYSVTGFKLSGKVPFMTFQLVRAICGQRLNQRLSYKSVNILMKFWSLIKG